MRIEEQLVSLKTPLDFPSGNANIHFAARPTCHFKISYGITATLMRIAHGLFDTGAVVNLIQSSMIPTSWAHHIKRDGLPTLRTATKQLLLLNGLILLHLRIGDLNTRVWFGVAPWLAFDVLLGTAFIDRLCAVFSRQNEK